MTDLFPAFWLYSLVFVLVAASVLVFADRQLKRFIPSIVTLGVLLLLGSDLYLALNHFTPVERPVMGWIWPREEAGSLRIGYAPDSFTFALTAILGVGLVFRAWARPYSRLGGAASLFAMGGVMLAWSSKTVWLSFGGQGISIFAAGLLLIGSARNEAQTGLAHGFLKRNVLGLLSAIIGACGLLSMNVSLDYSSSASWAAHAEEFRFLVSLTFLAVGAFVQIAPLTGVSGLLRGSTLDGADFPLFGYWVPALSAMSVLMRMSPGFRSVDFTLGIGIAAALTLLLLVISVFFARGHKREYDAWAALGPTVALLGWAFGSSWIACMILMAGLIQAIVLGYALELPRNGWSRGVVWMTVVLGAGMIGSITTGAYCQLWASLSVHTALLVPSALAVFAYHYATVRQGFLYHRKGKDEPQPIGVAIFFQVFALLLLGVVWMGRVSGGAFPDGVDEIAGLQTLPWAEQFESHLKAIDPAAFVLGSITHWGSFAVAFILGIFSMRSGKEWFARTEDTFPKTDRFFRSGLGLEPAAEFLAGISKRMSRGIVRWTDEELEQNWIPRTAEVLGRLASRVGERTDRIADWLTADKFSKAVDAPAKLVQWMQSGDLQWYLIFALVSIAVVLVHFLRF